MPQGSKHKLAATFLRGTRGNSLYWIEMIEAKGAEFARRALSEHYRMMPVEELESFLRDTFDESTAALKELGEVVDATITPIRPVIEDDSTPQAG